MRNGIDTDTIAQLRLINRDSIHADVPIRDEYDVYSPYQTLHDDLAELPQAYAAFLDHQQNQWS